MQTTALMDVWYDAVYSENVRVWPMRGAFLFAFLTDYANPILTVFLKTYV